MALATPALRSRDSSVAEIEEPHRQAVAVGQQAAGLDGGLAAADEHARPVVVGGLQRVRDRRWSGSGARLLQKLAPRRRAARRPTFRISRRAQQRPR